MSEKAQDDRTPARSRGKLRALQPMKHLESDGVTEHVLEKGDVVDEDSIFVRLHPHHFERA